MAGVTTEGFVKKTLDEIKVEIEGLYKTAFGKNVNVRPSSVNGTKIGIDAEREAAIWDLAESVYQSQNPEDAFGRSLESVGALTNTRKLAASKSYVLEQLLFGTVGTFIPSDTTKFSVEDSPDSIFIVADDVTLIAGTNAIQHLAFSAVPTSGAWTITHLENTTSSLAWNANAAAVQTAMRAMEGYELVTVTGDYAAGFNITFIGPTNVSVGLRPQDLVSTTDTLLATATPVTITPTTTTPGVAQGTVRVNASVTGEVEAPAGSLTVIDTPIAGLDSTINMLDAELGRAVETDAAFRIRRKTELAKAGAASLPAIRSKLSDVADVNDVTAFENTTMSTDGDGRPPKSIQVYVDGGDDDDIANELWTVKPGGIELYGEVSVDIIDSQGVTQTVKFSRPVDVDVWVEVDLTVDADVYPSDGDTQVQDAILAYGDALTGGTDVLVYPKLLPAIVDVVPGILDIAIRVGLASNPTLDDNITVAPNEIARFDSSRIEVNS